jgi:hypothetical protein
MSLPENCPLDQFAAYSPWPARLLGLSPWEPKTKTPDEIIREYENEKWGPLWQRVQDAGRAVGLSELLSWTEDSSRQEFCSRGSDYVLLKPAEIHHHYLELTSCALQPWVPAPALVELGCGFGNVLFSLAKHFGPAVGQIIGGEFTKSGVSLLSYLAQQEKLPVLAGNCDLGAPGITPLPLPQDAIIYTSFATPYVRHLTPALVEDLCSFRPRVVVHFEPCYEHAESDSLIGLMRRRYIEVNDYNRNLMTVLKDAEKAGRIQIVRESPCVFGRNPLLPASIIAWKPLLA